MHDMERAGHFLSRTSFGNRTKRINQVESNTCNANVLSVLKQILDAGEKRGAFNLEKKS
jgi:hypothetical protein